MFADDTTKLTFLQALL